MMGWFSNPWGLASLLALPAIYWLHRYMIEARRRQVSNLALWSDRELARREGRVRNRIADQLVLWLELAAAFALALVVAGFDPKPGRAAHPRIALVLDASASMSGGSPGRRPLDRAREELRAAARAHPGLRVSLVLAAEQPALLGDADLTPERADALLADLSPQAASMRLAPALDLARALDLEADSIWVISDDPELVHPRLLRAGEPEPNLAIVRASWEQDQAPFLVVRRFGAGPAAIDVRVQLDGGPSELQHVAFDADGAAPLALRVEPDVVRVDVQLPGDKLALDDRATLLRPPARYIHVDASGTSPALQSAVQRAVAAIPALRAASGPADLHITETAPNDGRAALVFSTHGAGKSEPMLELLQGDPFSPLTAAWQSRGLLWYAWRSKPPATARVLLRAGPVPLLWQDGRATTLNLDLERSNFLRHAAFPIFLDALAQELDRLRGGLPRSSFALGEALRFLPDARWGVVPVSVQTPSGERLPFEAGREIDVGVLREPGVYELRAAERVERFAVALSSPAESNLAARKPPGTPPALAVHETASTDRSSAWLTWLLLVALGCASLAFTRLERRVGAS